LVELVELDENIGIRATELKNLREDIAHERFNPTILPVNDNYGDFIFPLKVQRTKPKSRIKKQKQEERDYWGFERQLNQQQSAIQNPPRNRETQHLKAFISDIQVQIFKK
jgi:hypothetical protein